MFIEQLLVSGDTGMDKTMKSPLAVFSTVSKREKTPIINDQCFKDSD
jgi:hypothetical protein